MYSSGLSEPASLEKTTEEQLDRAFGLNVRAMVLTAQRAVRHMSDGGAIVLLGSIAGSMANAGYGTYSATKAAVRSYARSWNAELAPRGIRVNTLSPGPTDTPMFDKVSDEFRQMMNARIPANEGCAIISPDTRCMPLLQCATWHCRHHIDSALRSPS